ncbi:hypothetical protein NCS56_01417300 [Fusarium sp. Ph1]|nr:hypothetical protein NCS56_01417300 [Fusarium sp. Ph1]
MRPSAVIVSLALGRRLLLHSSTVIHRRRTPTPTAASLPSAGHIRFSTTQFALSAMADKVISLLGDKAVSAQDAAQKLADPSRTAFVKDGDLSRFEEELNALWSNILSAAEKTPHGQQDKLVDVMRAIKGMPEPVHEGKKIEIWGQETRWDQLPMFGALTRERLDIAQSRSGQAFVNINAFFARLTVANIEDNLLFAIWVFRDALEDPAEDEIAQKTSPELLKAAAVWFIYAAESLAKARDEAEQFDGKVARPGDSLSAFKDVPGWRGFCPDRWNVWKARFASLEKTESLADAKPLIDQALDKLNKV